MSEAFWLGVRYACRVSQPPRSFGGVDFSMGLCSGVIGDFVIDE
jgi:hypothetical protein